MPRTPTAWPNRLAVCPPAEDMDWLRRKADQLGVPLSVAGRICLRKGIDTVRKREERRRGME